MLACRPSQRSTRIWAYPVYGRLDRAGGEHFHWLLVSIGLCATGLPDLQRYPQLRVDRRRATRSTRGNYLVECYAVVVVLDFELSIAILSHKSKIFTRVSCEVNHGGLLAESRRLDDGANR